MNLFERSPVPQKIFTRSILGSLYPDEISWSGFARLKYRFPHLTDSRINHLQRLKPRSLERYFTLPSNLPQLTMSFGYNDQIRLFSEKHTFSPWVDAVCFDQPMSNAPTEPLKSIQQKACKRVTKNSPLIIFGRTVLSQNLRVCRTCMKEELTQFGTVYWHRSHQFNGIPFCNIHKRKLLVTKIKRPDENAFHYTALTINTPILRASPSIHIDSTKAYNGQRHFLKIHETFVLRTHSFPESLFPADIAATI